MVQQQMLHKMQPINMDNKKLAQSLRGLNTNKDTQEMRITMQFSPEQFAKMLKMLMGEHNDTKPSDEFQKVEGVTPSVC